MLETVRLRFELMLVNPATVRALRGAKTDRIDAARIAEFLQHGLLRGSFVPLRPIRQLRDLARMRVQLQHDRNRVINRIGRLLETVNVKLGSVASNIVGKSGRAMLDAIGMFYREHPAPGVAEHTGAGVYYGAATTEAPVFSGRRVLVVGGGNSAGQGTMYLARYAKEVQIVVRRASLRDTMSQYLIDQIEKTPNIRVRFRTDIERVEGEGRVERVALTSLDNGLCQLEEADALFVFTGTRPRSDWLPPDVLRNVKGFVLTGRDLMAAEGYPRIWKETREPLPVETGVPGVFAAGDLRAGAMNPVASAVGVGSMVVRLAHEYLALT